MPKYDPLQQHLAGQRGQQVRLSFQEIEQIIGEPLPQAAYQYEWWWTNEDPRTTTHVQCRAWQGAGYKAEVQLAQPSGDFHALGMSARIGLRSMRVILAAEAAHECYPRRPFRICRWCIRRLRCTNRLAIRSRAPGEEGFYRIRTARLRTTIDAFADRALRCRSAHPPRSEGPGKRVRASFRRAAPAHGSQKVPACYEMIGRCVGLLDAFSSCAWKCSEGDHILERLVVRANNSARGAVRLGLMGFYDESLTLVRSVGRNR